MRGNDLLELGQRFLKSGTRYVGHEDIGTFFGEENRCFKTDASGKVVSKKLGIYVPKKDACRERERRHSPRIFKSNNM
jgi:hypothetical protein